MVGEKRISYQQRQDDGRGISHQVAKIAATIVVAIVIVAIVVALIPNIMDASRNIGQSINPPRVIITSKNCRTGTVGLDYVAWIDVSVHNDGGPGTFVVWARVTQGSGSWTKSVQVYLDSQGSKDLTLSFPEVGLWTLNSIYYSVWIE
jgi:hypothetical protein